MVQLQGASAYQGGLSEEMAKTQWIVSVFVFFVLTGSGGVWANSDSLGYCSVYTGRICKGHINARQVWFSSSDGTGGWLNEKTTADLFTEMISELPAICRAAAEVHIRPQFLCVLPANPSSFQKLLCAYAFPHCVLSSEGLALKLPLCYEGMSNCDFPSPLSC